MKKILFIVLVFAIIFDANAKFFGLDGYVIDKNHITKYNGNIYSVYIDYTISGTTKTNFTNTCIVQKDTSIYQPLECKKDKYGNYVVSYMKMSTLINTDDSTVCILSIMYYDRSDVLLQTRPLTTEDRCQWSKILPTSSLDIAQKYILKNQNKIKSESGS